MYLIKWKDSSGEVRKFRLVNIVSSKWEAFGYRLGIAHMLDGWREECLASAQRCWWKVMQYWLSEYQCDTNTPDYPATWEGMYEMLDDVEFSEVAKQLKEAVENTC